MLADDDWRPTFRQSCWWALGIALLAFIPDWSGYDKWDPNLFSPRPIREIWWHLPVNAAALLFAIQMARGLDWAKNRSLLYWIGYIVVLIAVVVSAIWLLMIELN